MKVRITSKEITGLEDTHYDLSIAPHFQGFIKKIEELFDRQKEFTVMELTERELYFHNLNHH